MRRRFFCDFPRFTGFISAVFLPIFLLLTLRCTPPVSGADWLTARGDAHSSGVAAGKISDAPKVKWTFAPKNAVFEATPVVADGIVYAGSLTGYFYAVDLKTGKEIWNFFSKLGFSAPAAISGGRVFVADSDGFFRALDAKTGKPLWTVETGGAMNAAPGIYKDRVLVTAESGELYALDVETGKEIWKYTSTDQLRCGVTIQAENILLGGCDKSLQVVSAETGVLGVRLEVDAQTGATVAVNPAGNAFLGTEAAEVIAISPELKILWRYSPEARKAPFRSNAAVTDTHVYIGGQNRMLTCLDAKTGKESWTFATRRNVDSSPVLVGNRVVFHAAEGKVHILDAGSGKSVWTFEPGGSLIASPAVVDGKIITVTGQGEIYCFE